MRRATVVRRFSLAVLLGVALAALSPVALPASAATAPGLDEALIVATTNGALRVSGTGVPTEQITITVGAITVCADVEVIFNGTWFCQITPADALGIDVGYHVLSATSFDGVATSAPTTTDLQLRFPAATNLGVPNPVTTETFTITAQGSDSPLTSIGLFPLGDTSAAPICAAPVAANNSWSCTLTRAELPGLSEDYELYVYSTGATAPISYSEPSTSFTLQTDPFEMPPPAPVITTPTPGSTLAVTGAPVSISGTGGLASGAKNVSIEVSQRVNGAWVPYCTEATVVSDDWICTGTTALPPGTRQLRATQRIANDFSTVGAAVTYIVSSPTIVPTTVPPVVAPRVAPEVVPPLTMALSGTEFAPGESVEVTGDGAFAARPLRVDVHSDPLTLGTITASADGTYRLVATIPEGVEPGAHSIVVTSVPARGTPVSLSMPITVTEAPPAPPAPPVAAPETSDPVDAPTAVAATTRAKPGADSALTDSLITPAQLFSSPLVGVTAAALGLAFALLVLLSAEFLGGTLANHYGALGRFLDRHPRLHRAATTARDWISRHRIAAGLALITITSAVMCLVDPGFGFDLASLRLLLACAPSIVLVGFLSAVITEGVSQRSWGIPVRLEVLPWGLAIAVLGVVTSRLLDFAPGFLLGPIIGLSIVGEIAARLRVRVILLRIGIIWVTAIAAWAVIPLLPKLPEAEPLSFVTTLAADALAATAAGGLTALLVILLPLALFEGGDLWAQSKLLWVGVFGVVAASFCLIVVPRSKSWIALGDGLFGWMLLTLAFIAVAAAVYVLTRWLKARSARPVT